MRGKERNREGKRGIEGEREGNGMERQEMKEREREKKRGKERGKEG